MANLRMSKVIVGFVALLSLHMALFIALPPMARAYTVHAPILIDGNAGFTSGNGVIGGNGTASDPYVIEGWQIDASAANGITIINTDAYAIVRGVYVHSGGVNYDGIYLRKASNLVVEGGVFVNNNYGIVVYESYAVTIENNDASGSFWEGIFVPGSSSVVIRGNDVRFSGVYGIDILTSSDVEVRDNMALSGYETGIFVENSARVFVTGNNVSSNNLLGIGLDSSSDITVMNNSLWHNDYGLDLFSTEQVFARQNTIGNSITMGVSVYYSNNVTLEGNEIISNELGLYAGFSKDILIARNVFDRNVIQGEDEFGARTAWDEGYPAGGNYWTDYGGTDNCSGPAQDVCPDPDGIGDVPYAVDADTSDRYPLMQPWMASHAPIQISSNAGFTPSNGVTAGSGTVSDPFIIDGWDLNSSLAHGIWIANTDAHLVIRDVFVHSLGSMFDNIFLENATNISVKSALLDGSGKGLSVRNSSVVLAVDTWILNSKSECIQVINSTSVAITGDFMRSCTNWGINAQASSNLNISGNRFSNGGGGVSLQSDDHVIIAQNSLTANNLHGPGKGLALDKISNVTVDANDLLKNQHGIVLTNSRDTVLQNNTVTGSTIEAASIANSNNITLLRNNFTLGGSGLSAAFVNDLTIAQNGVSSNSGDGIRLKECGTVSITANDISYNGGYGLNSNASIIMVSHNDFLLNAMQAYDDSSGTSSWNDSYPAGGNYWSNYTGSDSMSGPNQDQPGGDGIGDTPLFIQGGSNKDMYPLMRPSIPRPIPDLIVPPSSVWFSPASPIPAGSLVSINAVVWNIGSGPSGPFVARFYDGVPPSPQIDVDQQMTSIPVGTFTGVSASWTPLGVGNHTVCVGADPDNIVIESDETNNMVCVDVEVIFSIDLAPGHHFISFPLIVSDQSIWNVLSSIWGCYDYVRWYNPTDAVSPWRSYVPGRGFDSLSNLSNTMGFWIGVTSYCTLVPVGVKPVATTVSLYQGWNMIGFPSFNASYSVADLKADIGLSGIIVEAFDANAASSNLQRVNDGYVMKAGEGYWVFVPSDTTWVMNG